MYPSGSRKCVSCNEGFWPDPRNRRHQRHCTKPVCRRASKVASQRRWRAKPANADYDRGNAKNAARARAWQRAHPGYWKRRRAKTSPVLRDLLIPEVAVDQRETNQDVSPVLQDLYHVQVPLMMGLIAHLGDLSYVEDIASMAHRFVARGQALMGAAPS